MNSHPIVHVEIAAKDPAAIAKFYSELCGWQVQAAPTGPGETYHMFRGEGGPGGGFPGVDGQMYKSGDIVPYVSADDIDAFLKKAESLGGKTLLPKTEIPGQGWFAFFADPSGNRIGVFSGMNAQS